MPESVNRRGSSGPTIGATEGLCWSARSSVVAMWPRRLRAAARALRCAHEGNRASVRRAAGARRARERRARAPRRCDRARCDRGGACGGRRSGRHGGQPRGRAGGSRPARQRRARADPARERRRDPFRAAVGRGAAPAGARSARRRGRHVLGCHARGRLPGLRGLYRDGGRADRGDRRRRDRAPRALPGGGRPPGWAGRARRAQRDRRRERAAPRGRVRGSARDHRRDQGTRADLEARGGRVDPSRLRDLPSVDRLATSVAKAVLQERREELLGGARDDADLVERAAARLRPSLRRVVNATGVIVHTNLGRAPLAEDARAAVLRAATGYSNLELDLADGRRGSRHEHVEALLRELTGAEGALVVNNCAAAVLLAAAALAGDGREIVVSRGQLIEIGGSFRIPDVVAQSGAALREVGTTNRTRLRDYASALGDSTGAILRAHPSNFRAIGFVEDVSIEALCGLGVPVIDDVGSGVLADDAPLLAEGPAVRRWVRAGAALVCFSGDKLLGGPQAGVIVGTADAVAAAKRHPLARALRLPQLSPPGPQGTLPPSR